MEREPIRNFDIETLTERLASLGEPPFRARQIAQWVYLKRIDSFDEMTNISKKTRQILSEQYVLRKPAVASTLVASAGDAVKFGLSLPETNMLTESVLLFDRARRTICVSSQLGCGLGCTFCATASMGLVRNLTHEEVIGQLVTANDYLVHTKDKLVTHVVFMGMGEALANFDVFSSVCRVITNPEGMRLAAKRITVSTAGVVPSIDRLTREGPPVNLAISLNEYNDERRSAIMPVNRNYPLGPLLEAARRFTKAGMGELTFEYVVRRGENDDAKAIASLTRLLHGIDCRINCIPLNDTSRGEGRSPEFEAVQQFARDLHARGLSTTVRRSRGSDISGACGQLCARSQQ